MATRSKKKASLALGKKSSSSEGTVQEPPVPLSRQDGCRSSVHRSETELGQRAGSSGLSVSRGQNAPKSDKTSRKRGQDRQVKIPSPQRSSKGLSRLSVKPRGEKSTDPRASVDCLDDVEALFEDHLGPPETVVRVTRSTGGTADSRLNEEASSSTSGSSVPSSSKKSSGDTQSTPKRAAPQEESQDSQFSDLGTPTNREILYQTELSPIDLYPSTQNVPLVHWDFNETATKHTYVLRKTPSRPHRVPRVAPPPVESSELTPPAKRQRREEDSAMEQLAKEMDLIQELVAQRNKKLATPPDPEPRPAASSGVPSVPPTVSCAPSREPSTSCPPPNQQPTQPPVEQHKAPQPTPVFSKPPSTGPVVTKPTAKPVPAVAQPLPKPAPVVARPPTEPVPVVTQQPPMPVVAQPPSAPKPQSEELPASKTPIHARLTRENKTSPLERLQKEDKPEMSPLRAAFYQDDSLNDALLAFSQQMEEQLKQDTAPPAAVSVATTAPAQISVKPNITPAVPSSGKPSVQSNKASQTGVKRAGPSMPPPRKSPRKNNLRKTVSPLKKLPVVAMVGASSTASSGSGQDFSPGWMESIKNATSPHNMSLRSQSQDRSSDTSTTTNSGDKISRTLFSNPITPKSSRKSPRKPFGLTSAVTKPMTVKPPSKPPTNANTAPSVNNVNSVNTSLDPFDDSFDLDDIAKVEEQYFSQQASQSATQAAKPLSNGAVVAPASSSNQIIAGPLQNASAVKTKTDTMTVSKQPPSAPNGTNPSLKPTPIASKPSQPFPAASKLLQPAPTAPKPPRPVPAVTKPSQPVLAAPKPAQPVPITLKSIKPNPSIPTSQASEEPKSQHKQVVPSSASGVSSLRSVTSQQKVPSSVPSKPASENNNNFSKKGSNGDFPVVPTKVLLQTSHKVQPKAPAVTNPNCAANVINPVAPRAQQTPNSVSGGRSVASAAAPKVPFHKSLGGSALLRHKSADFGAQTATPVGPPLCLKPLGQASAGNPLRASKATSPLVRHRSAGDLGLQQSGRCSAEEIQRKRLEAQQRLQQRRMLQTQPQLR